MGFTELYASKGIIYKSVYTGQTGQELATYAAKLKLMLSFSQVLAYDPGTSFAFGDSESDLPLLISVNPRNAFLLGAPANLRLQGLNNNWNIPENEDENLNNLTERINTLFPAEAGGVEP